MQNLFPYEKQKRNIILKYSDISTNYGINPEERNVKTLFDYGIINVDKPQGPSSHQVSGYVKQILNLKKCGHSGTLDPNVTGVLPTALGKSTKVLQAILSAGKEYVGIMHIHKDVSKEKVLKVFKEFTGEIIQMPPVRSAVKRRNRKRQIYYLNLIEMNKKDVLFKVGCQAGTYIRKLCFDMGVKLKTGANMQELRRTRVASFFEDSLATLQDIKDAYYYYKEGNEKPLKKIIQPIEVAVKHIPKVWIHDSAIESISHGRDLAVPGIIKLESWVEKGKLTAILSLKGELIALGNSIMDAKEIELAEKGIAIPVHKVLA